MPRLYSYVILRYLEQPYNSLGANGQHIVVIPYSLVNFEFMGTSMGI